MTTPTQIPSSATTIEDPELASVIRDFQKAQISGDQFISWIYHSKLPSEHDYKAIMIKMIVGIEGFAIELDKLRDGVH